MWTGLRGKPLAWDETDGDANGLVKEVCDYLSPTAHTGSRAAESKGLFVAALRLVTRVPGAKFQKYSPPRYMQLYHTHVWQGETGQQPTDLPPYATGTLASVWYEALGQQLAQNMGQHVLSWWRQARRLSRASLACALQQAWLHPPSYKQRRPLEQAALGTLLKGDGTAVFTSPYSVCTAVAHLQQLTAVDPFEQQLEQQAQQLQQQRAELAAVAHSNTIRSCQRILQTQVPVKKKKNPSDAEAEAVKADTWQDRLFPLTDEACALAQQQVQAAAPIATAAPPQQQVQAAAPIATAATAQQPAQPQQSQSVQRDRTGNAGGEPSVVDRQEQASRRKAVPLLANGPATVRLDVHQRQDPASTGSCTLVCALLQQRANELQAVQPALARSAARRKMAAAAEWVRGMPGPQTADDVVKGCT